MKAFKKVLIISYTFPPAPGIGGRRWAKFGKYLLQKNIDVSIVAAENQLHPKTSSWVNDISHYSNNISYLSSGYPKYLGINPQRFFHKLLYRISLLYAKARLKGNYYDKSGYWEKYLLKTTEHFIKRGGENIVVTVAPFRSAFFLIKLKRKFPQINFIIDFRDPWLYNKTAYGFESLSLRRKKFEMNAEMEVIKNFDKIITVAEEMTKELTIRYPDHQKKFITIPNGFDKDDFITKNAEIDHNKKSKLVLIFTGTFYVKALHLLNKLFEALTLLKANNPDVYNDFEFNFYGETTFNTSEFIKMHGNVNFYGNITLDEVYIKIKKANACMLFLTDDINYSLSTKFCEYISQRKPVIVFSRPGETSSYIEKNNIGIAISPETEIIYKKLLEIYFLFKENKLMINDSFDISQFDIEILSEKVKNILI